MPTPTKRTTICIPRDLWKRVRRHADELDIPVQKWLEDAARTKLDCVATKGCKVSLETKS